MSLSLRISLILFSLILIIITSNTIKRGRMPIKYSLLWYFSSMVILLVAVFPSILEFFAKLLGFVTVSNLVIGIIISLLLFLTMSLTIITAGQQRKITLLIQEISILKSNSDRK